MVFTKACKGYLTYPVEIYISKFTELSTNCGKDHSSNIFCKEMVIMQEEECHQYV